MQQEYTKGPAQGQTSWCAQAKQRAPVRQVASELGLQLIGRDRVSPCPSCRASTRSETDTRQGPVRVITGDTPGWFCHRCRKGGSVIDMVLMAGHSFREAQDWFVRRGWADGDPGQSVERVVPKPVQEVKALEYLEPEKVLAVLRACVKPSGATLAYLEGRCLAGAPCGVLEASQRPDWWPIGPKDNRGHWWPIVVPMYDSRGVVRSIHGRAITSNAPRKTANPRGHRCDRLLFLDPVHARPWVQGSAKCPSVTLIVEGMTDYLSGCVNTDYAVIGITSGSAPAIADLKWSQDAVVVICTDPDKPGDAYARKICEALPDFVRWSRLDLGAK